MNWISLLIQIFALRKTANESHALIDAAKAMAERGKRTFVSFLVLALSALFFFSALLVAIIDLGLQIDKNGFLSYSGLMISATILSVIGLLLVMLSLLVARMEPVTVERVQPRSSAREDRIKDLLEGFLVSFLNRLGSKGNERPKQD